MDKLWLIVVMMLIGAIIGGFTNFIAIRMLFRPHKPKYIGKWQLPFTPGLIPKRHQELASQVGKIVVNHLLTPESIQKKLHDPEFKQSSTELITQKINAWIDDGMTVKEILSVLQIEEPEQKTKAWIQKKAHNKYDEIKNSLRDRQLNEVIPQEWIIAMEGKVPDVADQITMKVTNYFKDEEGKARIKHLLENFLQERGRMWNMIQMFIGHDSLADKLQPELVKLFQHPGTKQMLTQLLLGEMKKIEAKSVKEFIDRINDEKTLAYIDRLIDDIVPVDQLFDQSIAELIEPFREKMETDIVPKVINMAGLYIVDHIEEMLERFQVEEIVRDQIEAFSLETLEEIVVSIAKKELVMITYLGALLGGVIGIFQGLLVVLTS